MTEPACSPAAPLPSIWRRPAPLLVALALVAYAILIGLHIGAYASGSDSSGYMNHARLLASGRLHATPRFPPGLTPDEQKSMLCIPLGFVPAPDGNGMVPTYPAGLPLLIAATARVVGWAHAGDVVIGLHSLLGLLLVYALGRAMGLSPLHSVLGATIVAASPLYLNYSVQMMSDLPALVWTLAAVLAAWRSRERAAWALAAGAATAMAVLIRPTNILIFAPVAIALGLSPRRWILLIAGGLPGAIFFCIDNLSLYGRLLTTGYGNFSSSFGLHWVGVTLWHYAGWLPVLFTPVALLSLGLPWIARTKPLQAALLGVWIFVFAGFYATYDCTHETWWYLRFLLPAVPPLVIGGLLVLRQTGIGRRWPILRTRLFVFALIAIIANSALWNKRLPSLSIGHDNAIYPEAATWLKDHLPANAVILSMQMSGTLYYYTDFTFLRWDLGAKEDRPHAMAALREACRPLYAALFPFERRDALEKRFPGPWTRIARISNELEVWRYGAEPPNAIPSSAPASEDHVSDFIWRLPIDQSSGIRRAWLYANGIAWLALAVLSWRLIPGNNGRDWLARCGILLSAGAVGSVRLGLTDLIALTLLAGAMLAAESRRRGWATALVGVAGLGRGTALLALPATGDRPWISNLRRWLPALAIVAVATAGVCWRLGGIQPLFTNFTWPFGSLLERWVESLSAVLNDQGLGFAWIGFAVLFSFTTQVAFFIRHWKPQERWWRLGIAYAGFMCFLDDASWMGAAGGASRLLLPLTLAFNVFARRARTSAVWLVLGNLGVAAGICSLIVAPEAPADMAAIRAAGFARLTDPKDSWYWVEQNSRHTRAWSRGSATLDIETWPHASRTLNAEFSLHSLSPRTVAIRQGGRLLWSGVVNKGYTPVAFSCKLTRGHALLDLDTNLPGIPESADPNARDLAFALYDPFLAASNH